LAALERALRQIATDQRGHSQQTLQSPSPSFQRLSTAEWRVKLEELFNGECRSSSVVPDTPVIAINPKRFPMTSQAHHSRHVH
jgi:hypothetical protein